MKLFGFEFRKFEQETTTVEAVETWCVKWLALTADDSREDRYYPQMDWQVQAFPSEDAAEFFAKELRDARALLGDKRWTVKVYKQTTHSNI